MSRLSTPARVVGLMAFAAPAAWSAQCDVQVLCPSDGHDHAHFGVAVDVRAGEAAIGAVRDSDIGACYVAKDGPSGWEITAKLVPQSIDFDRLFGCAVGIEGDWIAVGAMLENSSGTVRMFRRGSGDRWTDEGLLAPSGVESGDSFGFALDMDGDRLAVASVGDDEGAVDAGAVYVFELEAGVWVERQKVLPPSPVAGDHFGSDVSLDGDRLLVGAREQNVIGNDSGAAFVFERAGNAWSLVDKLSPSNAEADAWFGGSVSLLGDRALVGAPEHGLNDRGAAYVFSRQGTLWVEEANLTASGITSNDHFGEEVRLLSEYRAVVGATGVGSGAGAAHVFARTGTTWAQVEILSGNQPSERFGAAIGADGSDLIIGAYENPCHGIESGTAYAFEVAVLRYCTTSPNSVGPGAWIDVEGSTSLALNGMSLRATALPPGRFGLFYYGPEPALVPMDQGFLCVGPGSTGTHRLYPGEPSSSGGELVRTVDFGAPPMNQGPGQITVGSTWYFQLWYRDVVGSNLTDAVQVAFCP